MRKRGVLLVALVSLSQEGFAQQPTVHRVAPDTFWNTLWRGHPVVARIKPGDIVVTRTLDAGGRDERNILRAQPSNPMVGPSIYIERAEPGDGIAVTFRKIRPNRGTAWSFYRLGLFALTPSMIEGIYPNTYKPDLVRPGRADLLVCDVDTARNTVKLREPVSSRHRLEFPMEPMLGVVGVAPAGDFAPTSGPSREYGGNMDFNEIRLATSDMVRWLTRDYGMEPWAAHMLIGAKGEYEIVTLMGSAALKIAKRWLPATP